MRRPRCPSRSLRRPSARRPADDERGAKSVLPRQPLFSPGQVVATPGALDALSASAERAMPFVLRHVCGDWGELSRDDWLANDAAVQRGSRILSAYRTARGRRFWIITEADRSVTTLLLPEDY